MEALIGIPDAIETIAIIAVVVGCAWAIVRYAEPRAARLERLESRIDQLAGDTAAGDGDRSRILEAVQRMEVSSEQHDQRLQRIEGWTESLSGRISGVDRRLDSVEQRLTAIDGRIAGNGTSGPVERRPALRRRREGMSAMPSEED